METTKTDKSTKKESNAPKNILKQDISEALWTIQKPSGEYAAGVIHLNGRDVILWHAYEKPFYIAKELGNFILSLIQRFAQNGDSYVIKTYQASIKETESKTLTFEPQWKLTQ